jgi:hypothetical protein
MIAGHYTPETHHRSYKLGPLRQSLRSQTSGYPPCMASTQTEHHIIIRKDWRTRSDKLSTPKKCARHPYIVRDHQIVTVRLREKTKKTDRVWELEDLDDNAALGKGTGLKTVNMVSTSHLVRTIIHYRI